MLGTSLLSGPLASSAANYLYARDGSTLFVYDVTNPANMFLANTVVAPSNFTNLSIDTANSVGYGVSGRVITAFDLSNPLDIPTPLTHSLAQGGMQQCVLDPANNVLYATDNSRDGIKSIDVSDNANMSLLDAIEYSSDMGNPHGIVIHNDFAFLACSQTDVLAAVDISDPSNLSYSTKSLTANLNHAYTAALDAANSIVYVTGQADDSLVAVDISNPGTSLPQLGHIASGTNMDNANNIGLDLINEVAYVTSYQGITSIDISDPGNMSILDFYNGDGSYSFFWNIRIDAESQIAYSLDWIGGVLIALDISDPNDITELGTLTGHPPYTYFA